MPYRPCRASLATKRLPQINTYRGFSMSTTPLYTAVLRALERPNPTLFLGAGVGVRVGYPAWSDYLESLATACQTWNDPASATLIRQRVLREKYPGGRDGLQDLRRHPAWRALEAACTTVYPAHSPILRRICSCPSFLCPFRRS